MDTEEVIPPVGGGSLMLAWQVRNKRVLVVGAGDVALSRVDHLLVADAKITVVTGPTVHPTIVKYNELGLLDNLVVRNFEMKDLLMYEQQGLRESVFTNVLDEEDDERSTELIQELEMQKFHMVLTCITDYDLSLRIWKKCKRLGLNVNLADKPKFCDFYFGSVYRQGPLQIMISTNGKSPRLCNRIKNKMLIPLFEDLNLDVAVENLSYLRGKLRNEIHPGEETDTIKERMDWNRKITDFYSIKEWCSMSKAKIDRIVNLYPELPVAEELNELNL
ncbi:hypothetical protein CANINC_000221 [Pichia inconspicua]|uniref:precorrin-2 dehydrogenase n=1 Tax=Pichia inconspicua TaxID=52247 RepID=A0A4T0X8W1_9ASCO|nr:hypothetical protein CANINC_000221 [[Candida] inconspicua]